MNRTGRISGFRKIGATVGLAGKASANILAQARLVDAGYGVNYDSVLDQYEVEIDLGPIIFAKRARGRGRRLPYYTYVIERACVETATGNKARKQSGSGSRQGAPAKIRTRIMYGKTRVADQVERT